MFLRTDFYKRKKDHKKLKVKISITHPLRIVTKNTAVSSMTRI